MAGSEPPSPISGREPVWAWDRSRPCLHEPVIDVGRWGSPVESQGGLARAWRAAPRHRQPTVAAAAAPQACQTQASARAAVGWRRLSRGHFRTDKSSKKIHGGGPHPLGVPQRAIPDPQHAAPRATPPSVPWHLPSSPSSARRARRRAARTGGHHAPVHLPLSARPDAPRQTAARVPVAPWLPPRSAPRLGCSRAPIAPLRRVPATSSAGNPPRRSFLLGFFF